MTTPQYNWNPSKEQIEAGIRRLGEIMLQAELRRTVPAPSLGREVS